MSVTVVRKPAVAGMFYPANPRELRQMVRGFLKKAKASGPVPKAIIAPHAGYIYSGPIAATAYARLVPARDVITRVVLLGPAHRVPFAGLAAPSVDAFSTPLGDIPVDKAGVAQLRALPQIQVLDLAHATEHSLEVQLPFLQEVLAKFTLLPLCVGDTDPKQISEVLDKTWGGPETLIVVSSDLSHYQAYETSQQMDGATSQAIEKLQPEGINYEQACGRLPIQGLLLAAKQRGMKCQTVDLRSSGDTAGPRDEVVGYGAYVFT